jgi:glycerate dehydrogenase
MNIVVLDGYTLNPGDNPWTEVEQLGRLTVHERTAPAQVLRRAASAQILLTNKAPVTGQSIAGLPLLRYIGVLATGHNIVDGKAAASRGIPVTNVPEYGTRSVAQFVFALLLELCHRVGRHDQAVRRGEWARRGDFSFWDGPLVELAGKTMAVVGFGRIGRRVGELAHAFGMEVLAVDPQPGPPPGPPPGPQPGPPPERASAEPPERPYAPPYAPFAWVQLPEACARADVLSLNCALNEGNRGLVNAALLARMKPSAFLINAARGPLVDEPALAAALNAGALAGAALDVAVEEPIRPDNPLLAARNCLLTPHMAWATLEARRRLMHEAAENLRAFLAGRVRNRVN